MNLTASMKKVADQINGQYSEYNDSQSVVIVPVSGGRYQTVLGNIRQNELYNRRVLSFSSKVCIYQESLDLKALIEQTFFFNYCRFVIKEGYVQIEAVAAMDSVSDESLKEMVLEVANLADQYELKLTGKDVH